MSDLEKIFSHIKETETRLAKAREEKQSVEIINGIYQTLTFLKETYVKCIRTPEPKIVTNYENDIGWK